MVADGDGGRVGWSAAWLGAAAVTGSIAGTLWNSAATTGPRVLFWPAAGLSMAALVGLHMCFASLGGWWPVRRLPSGVTEGAVLALTAREAQPETLGPISSVATGMPLPVRPGASVPSQVVVGDIPQQPPGFQLRAELLAELDRSGSGVSVVHAVTGMRGVGKTQLVAAYARAQVAAGWRLVAWVNAEDTTGLLAGLAAVAEAAGLTERIVGRGGTDAGRAVRHQLEVDGDRCLIVFDNASDADLLRPFIPAAGAARVLITSNLKSMTNLGTSVSVNVFTAKEAMAFLTDRTGLSDAVGAAEVATELGFLPLALAQAAAVIARQHLGYKEYLDRLRSLPVKEYLIRGEGQPYPHGVAETVLLSLSAVAAGDLGEVSVGMLEVISVLSAAGVRRDLLYAAGQRGALGRRRRWQRARVPEGVADEALGWLAERSLVTFSLDGQVIIAHRLVTRVVRDGLSRQGRLMAVCRATASLLNTQADALVGSQNRSAIRDIPEQAAALRETVAECVGDNDQTTKLLLRPRFWALYYLSMLGDSTPQAIAVGEPLVADYERMLGADDPQTLTTQSNLAVAYMAAGRVDEAIALDAEVLPTLKRALGARDPQTLITQSNLAVAYMAAGRVNEAIELHQQVLAALERALGEDHRYILNSRHNLAIAYRGAGRLAEAIVLHEQVLAALERVLGADHIETLKSQHNLAIAYQDAGRIAEAVELYEEALTAFERALGGDHPDTLKWQNNLAVAYMAAGQIAEAIALHEQVHVARERVLGADHPDSLQSRDNLAIAYGAVGRAQQSPPIDSDGRLYRPFQNWDLRASISRARSRSWA